MLRNARGRKRNAARGEGQTVEEDGTTCWLSHSTIRAATAGRSCSCGRSDGSESLRKHDSPTRLDAMGLACACVRVRVLMCFGVRLPSPPSVCLITADGSIAPRHSKH